MSRRILLLFLRWRLDVRGESGSAGSRSPPTFLLLPDLDIQERKSSKVLFISKRYRSAIGKAYLLHVAYTFEASMRIEVRKRGNALAALDDKGNPLMVAISDVRNYGRGNQVYLPKEWERKKVVVIDITNHPG